MLGDLGLPSWLSVPRPDPKLPAEVVFNIFGFPITNSVIAAWLTIIVLVGISYAVTRKVKLIPSRLQAFLESILGWLYGFCQEVAGEENGRRFFPVVTTIFLFVIMNAWLGLLPGFGSIYITGPEGEHVHLLRPANTDINMPLAIALMSFIFVEYFGIRSLGGFRYLSKFVNVGGLGRGLKQVFSGKLKAGMGEMFSGAINIFVGMLEALSELIRIVSFTFRLFGNMTAGEILLLIVMFLVPWVVALPFYGLELLVGFVQALIFGGLTLVFLTLAVAHHGAEAH
ncbi:MAG: F0F1 ATP synthase subunit A [Dehalococcoidia bacterium]|nr:MAG: F0F1 ATP synthase subunit A [Dehalococcoidia bacterium]